MGYKTKAGPAIDWLALWILFSSWCSLSGWFLSLLGDLNPWGYGIALLVFIGGLFLFGKFLLLSKERPPFSRGRLFYPRWMLPNIWLGLTILIFIGGLLYHPNNYDYLTYRF